MRTPQIDHPFLSGIAEWINHTLSWSHAVQRGFEKHSLFRMLSTSVEDNPNIRNFKTLDKAGAIFAATTWYVLPSSLVIMLDYSWLKRLCFGSNRKLFHNLLPNYFRRGYYADECSSALLILLQDEGITKKSRCQLNRVGDWFRNYFAQNCIKRWRVFDRNHRALGT